jgi:hypothetical protein
VSYSLRVIQQSKSSETSAAVPAAQKNVLPAGSISIHMKREKDMFTSLFIISTASTKNFSCGRF